MGLTSVVGARRERPVVCWLQDMVADDGVNTVERKRNIDLCCVNLDDFAFWLSQSLAHRRVPDVKRHKYQLGYLDDNSRLYCTR
jgi:hypothetical protein